MQKIFLTLLCFIFLCTISFAQSCLPDGIGFTNQSEIDNFAINYPNCTCIEGSVDIFGKNMTSLAGLSQITQIKGDLRINYLSAPDFTGFDNLTRIGGHLSLFGNKSESTAGFGSLAHIDSYVRIIYNELNDLEGFTDLESIGQGLILRDNDNLTSLDGLDNVTTIHSAIWLCDNELLSDLSSLSGVIRNDKIKTVRIKNNPNLPVCEVAPICDFLNRGSGETIINNNAAGCNSEEELCCTFVSVTDQIFIYSDMDEFVDGAGITTKLEAPTFASDATCNNIVMEGYFRVIGTSCESDIEIEITDPAGNPIFMGNLFGTCNGSGSSHPVGALYSVRLPIPMAMNVEPGDWTVQFTDSNDQNSGAEYLVGFVSLVADCAYEVCEDDVEDRSEEVLIVEEVSIYPIPVNQQLNIDYYVEKTHLLTYEIYSTDGKAALRGEEFVVRGKNTFQVNVASLPAGQYYIRMDDSELIQTKPFVKM